MQKTSTEPTAFDTFSHDWLGGFRRRAAAELERATDGRDGPLAEGFTYYNANEPNQAIAFFAKASAPGAWRAKLGTALTMLANSTDAEAAGAGTVRGYVGMALGLETETVVIQGVLENSPAEKAGLKPGDLLVSVGGQAAGRLETTVDLVRREKPGSDIAIRVRRDGKEKDITVRVAAFPFELLEILG